MRRAAAALLLLAACLAALSDQAGARPSRRVGDQPRAWACGWACGGAQVLDGRTACARGYRGCDTPAPALPRLLTHSTVPAQALAGAAAAATTTTAQQSLAFEVFSQEEFARLLGLTTLDVHFAADLVRVTLNAGQIAVGLPNGILAKHCDYL